MRYAFILVFIIFVKTSVSLEEIRLPTKDIDNLEVIYCSFGEDTQDVYFIGN